MTYTILISNSDDKLSQARWAHFCNDLRETLAIAPKLHFFGFTPSAASYQRGCAVIEIDEHRSVELMNALGRLATNFHQDYITLIEGKTEFVRGS